MPTCPLVRNISRPELLKADRLKAGGIKPGTWALKGVGSGETPCAATDGVSDHVDVRRRALSGAEIMLVSITVAAVVVAQDWRHVNIYSAVRLVLQAIATWTAHQPAAC